LAFKNISQTSPVYFIVIPKNRDGLTGISKAEPRHESLLGHLMVTAAKVAK
jgi:histidine triad (HIT) family protein